MRPICTLLLACLVLTSVSAKPDYLDNDLRKVCHPVHVPLDVLFILDGSGSVGGETFDLQLRILDRLIDSVEIGEGKTQIAVMQYSSYTFVESLFNTYKEKQLLRAAVRAIEHRSGTTRTGKALDKALQLFKGNFNSGARRQGQIGRVAVVVSDGHSHDNPMPAAAKLREAGVSVLALGIGLAINMDELVAISGSANHAFDNLTNAESASSAARFLSAFNALSKSEQCEYSRGPDGVEIKCLSDAIEVGVSTKKDFEGLFYVDSQLGDERCVWQGDSARRNSSSLRDPTLRVPLDACGVESSFSINPKGHFFQTSVRLQFHPLYATPKDRTFNVQCFYADKFQHQEPVDWQLIKEHTQRRERADKKALPCSLTITPRSSGSGGGEKAIMLPVGHPIDYRWSCNSENFDTYHSVLVHSCLLDGATAGNRSRSNDDNPDAMIIDPNGCSTEPSLIPTPTYPTPLGAVSSGVLVGRTGELAVRMRCRVKFCDRLMGECEHILPPKCGQADESTMEKSRYWISRYVRATSAAAKSTERGLPSLVTFKKHDKTQGSQRKRKVVVKANSVRVDNSTGNFSVANAYHYIEGERLVVEDSKANSAVTRVLSNSTYLNSPGPPEMAGEREEDTNIATTRTADDPFQNASPESSERSKPANSTSEGAEISPVVLASLGRDDEIEVRSNIVIITS